MTTALTKTMPNIGLAITKTTNAVQLAEIFDQIATKFKHKGKKIGMMELALAGQNSEGKIEVMREIFKSGEVEAVKNIWDICKAELKYRIAFLDDVEVDLEVIKNLGLQGDFIAKGFMSFHALEFVRETPYSKHIHRFSDDVATRLYELILTLPIEYAKEIIMHLEVKTLYLLCSNEAMAYIDEDQSNGTYFFCAVLGECKSPVPSEMLLTLWLQDNMPEVFKVVMAELFNPNWPELREMFYELYRRNQAQLSDNDQTIEKYLNS